MKHFQEHPGNVVHIDDLTAAIPGTDNQNIQSAISFIKARKNFPIEVVISGQAYRYHPNAPKAEDKPSRRVFEEIGVARDGSIVIQDEAGKLYVAREL